MSNFQRGRGILQPCPPEEVGMNEVVRVTTQTAIPRSISQIGFQGVTPWRCCSTPDRRGHFSAYTQFPPLHSNNSLTHVPSSANILRYQIERNISLPAWFAESERRFRSRRASEDHIPIASCDRAEKHMINITFPDGNAREYEAGTDGFAIALSPFPNPYPRKLLP